MSFNLKRYLTRTAQNIKANVLSIPEYIEFIKTIPRIWEGEATWQSRENAKILRHIMTLWNEEDFENIATTLQGRSVRYRDVDNLFNEALRLVDLKRAQLTPDNLIKIIKQSYQVDDRGQRISDNEALQIGGRYEINTDGFDKSYDRDKEKSKQMELKLRGATSSHSRRKGEKIDLNSPTEARLRSGPAAKEPTQVSEGQLKPQHSDGKAQLMEKRLEKVRTGAAEGLAEHLLNTSKSKLVQHRNKSASEGDFNKIEEQRIAGKLSEKEKYDPASSSDPKTLPSDKPGPDGLRLASTPRKAQRGAIDFGEVYDIGEFDIGMPDDDEYLGRPSDELMSATDHPDDEIDGFQIITPDDDEDEDIVDNSTDDVDAELEKVINDITSDIEIDDEDMSAIDSEEGELHTVDVRKIDQGGRSLSQYEFTFDPMAFSSRDDVEDKAAEQIAATAGITVGQARDNLVVDFEGGRVIATVPTKPPMPSLMSA